MRRLNLALLASLQLCRARSPGFSIHEDLLAFPQFEVIFSESYISEKDAQALLESKISHPTYSADFSQPTAAEAHDADGIAEDGEPGSAQSYEVLNIAPHRYLCSIPVIQPPPPENQTANELARAEEARELSRAATSGWELLMHLDDSCLYFMSGWWSYKFCNNREIQQFHALPSMAAGQSPRRDPHTADYILGRYPTIPAASEKREWRGPEGEPLPAELQVKGDQRYLVQKLEGGTVCDLTGRERTIEVQYHCVPGMKSDRIAWIKEVTICAYLMVINTPNLCNDVAFLPPLETRANPISCQLIFDGDDAPPQLDQTWPAGNDLTSDAIQEHEPADHEPLNAPQVTVGGVVVGSRKVISGADEAGKPPVKLAPPRSPFAPKQSTKDRLIELIAKAAPKEDGGRVEVMTKEELEKRDLQPEVVEEMREQMQKIAGDAGWKLEVVELPGGDLRELRGYIDGEEEEEGEEGEEGDGKGSEEEMFGDEL